VKRSDFPPVEIELWPDHWPVVQMFCRLATQWRVGAAGPTGLDYNVVYYELERAGHKGEDFDEMFECLRVMEHSALSEIYKQ